MVQWELGEERVSRELSPSHNDARRREGRGRENREGGKGERAGWLAGTLGLEDPAVSLCGTQICTHTHTHTHTPRPSLLVLHPLVTPHLKGCRQYWRPYWLTRLNTHKLAAGNHELVVADAWSSPAVCKSCHVSQSLQPTADVVFYTPFSNPHVSSRAHK